MTTTLLLITDRPGYFEGSIAQVRSQLPDFDKTVIVDDTDHELGFAGAIQKGWERIRDLETDWVFHLEDDFRFCLPVPLADMIELLERHPYLVQVALKRNPVNPQEIAAGGIVEQWPEEYEERKDWAATWTEHRLFFTTNPSVYSSRLCRVGWPDAPDSERRFTEVILRDPLARFAFWGEKFSSPWVEHVGERIGHGY